MRLGVRSASESVFRAAVILAACFQVQCEEDVIYDPCFCSPVFLNDALNVQASSNHAIPLGSMTVQQSTTPLYDGKGWFDFGMSSIDTIYLDSPIVDTLGVGGVYSARIRVEFTANVPSSMIWTLRFPIGPIDPFGVTSTVVMDSLRINGRYWHMNSDTARAHVPDGIKFTWHLTEYLTFYGAGKSE